MTRRARSVLDSARRPATGAKWRCPKCGREITCHIPARLFCRRCNRAMVPAGESRGREER